VSWPFVKDHRAVVEPSSHLILQKRQIHNLQSHSQLVHLKADRKQSTKGRTFQENQFKQRVVYYNVAS
jgi:transketolase C-terminal domain/subunit